MLAKGRERGLPEKEMEKKPEREVLNAERELFRAVARALPRQKK
jgi:hypothetical protein